MGVIITIEEYRKRRCLESLLAEIGLPSYCDECDDCGPDLLDAPHAAISMPVPAPPRHSATVLRFPVGAWAAREAAATPATPPVRRRAKQPKSH